jgi:hypothetical protein
MSLSKFFWWAGVIALSAILLDEGAYYIWRQRNRGEHWSHLTEKTPLITWETVNATR